MLKKLMGAAFAVVQYLQKDVREVAADVVQGGRALALGLTVATASVVSMVPAPAHAVVDYSGITEAADWDAVATAIIAVFAAAALVLVAFVGGKFLLRAIRGA